MPLRRCDAGEHTFDDSQHSSCPFCRKTRLATPPGGGGMGAGVEPNVQAGGNNFSPPPVGSALPPLQGKTTPAPGTSGGGQASGGTKTRIIFDGGNGNSAPDFGEVMPVVGWLVVISGKGRGRDLRITPGMNRIGRENGEILLNFGDASISREKHAQLAYDSDGNSFLLAHLDGRNLTKVNGKTVMDTYELSAYDHIRMGETEMIFVPLCGENFSWNTPSA